MIITKKMAIKLVAKYGSINKLCLKLSLNKSDISKIINDKIKIYRPGIKKRLRDRKINKKVFEYKSIYNLVHKAAFTLSLCHGYRKEPLYEDLRDYLLDFFYGRSAKQIEKIPKNNNYIYKLFVIEGFRFIKNKYRRKHMEITSYEEVLKGDKNGKL
jgi:hypothetical protein